MLGQYALVGEPHFLFSSRSLSFHSLVGGFVSLYVVILYFLQNRQLKGSLTIQPCFLTDGHLFIRSTHKHKNITTMPT